MSGDDDTSDITVVAGNGGDIFIIQDNDTILLSDDEAQAVAAELDKHIRSTPTPDRSNNDKSGDGDRS